LLSLAACCAIVLLVRGVGLPGGGSASTAADTAAQTETAEAFVEAPADTGDGIPTEYADAAPEMALTYGTEKSAVTDTARSSPYFAVLTLPADALEMELLADGTPVSESEGERRYELPAGEYDALLDQLDAAGIQPIAREQTGVESETALVIVTGL
ncbi:MAG: hypothetical protein Q4C45_06780, partial [Oscillospiraceae bacterium]|nr:hypothetical protein [Oscillospiraceae bacterium]